MTSKIKIALAQFAMTDEPKENLDKALTYIRRAAEREAQVVCLPELFRSPYFCVEESCPRDYSERLDGETKTVIGEVAKSGKIAVIAGSIYEDCDNKKYNTAMVFNAKGEMLGAYRKTHIPHDPAFFEMNYFEPGDSGFKVFDLGFAKVAALICYDQWFPEAARACALMGADIIFYPTAIGNVNGIEPTEGNWQEAWENVQRGHAIANCLVVAAVNRVGIEGKSTFWGGSFVCNAFGKTLVRGGVAEELIVQEIDLEHSRQVRESWRFFPSRRPGAYKGLSSD
ncbi:MAG: acyltransferase [Deltaproteobacteria bacterium]|nr:acyltransferase [Deltaproteobacteria bacterium]